MTKLSLCIPTYNRAAFLRETLDSILEQATDEVEIAISDNGSTDDTEQIVQQYQARFPRITYFRFPINQGADCNFLKVVEIASGEYCWLFGSDDRLEKGAIHEVLSKLALYPNLAGLSVNFWVSDFATSEKKWAPGVGLHEDTLFTDAEKGFEALCLLFGLLSAQVVRRALWMQIQEEKKVSGHFYAYVHVYMIGQLLLSQPCWLYLYTPCVAWRAGNDSFLDNGYYKRLEIDVLGYGTIIEKIFGTRPEFHQRILSKIANRHVFTHLTHIKFNTRGLSALLPACRLCYKHYSHLPVFWYRLLPILLLPSPLLKFLRFAYRITLKKYRTSRLSRQQKQPKIQAR